MREIKFRAWDNDIREMVYQDNNTRRNNSVIDAIFEFDEMGYSLMTNRYGEDEYITVMNFELMQYTGLKDKIDKEIYEGDIVKCVTVSNYSTEEYVSEVVWDDDCFMVHESNTVGIPLGVFRQNDNFQCPLSEIEVIGNIYENPELLEVAI